MVSPGILIGAIAIVLFVSILIFIKFYKNEGLKFIDWFVISLTTFNGLGFVFVLWATYAGKNSV